MEIDVGRIISTAINAGIIVLTISSIIKRKNNKTTKKIIKSTTKQISKKSKNNEMSRRNNSKPQNTEIVRQKLNKTNKNAKKQAEYLEQFLLEKDVKLSNEEVEKLKNKSKQKQKLYTSNEKNITKTKIDSHKNQENIEKEIDDLIYDYEKSNSKNEISYDNSYNHEIEDFSEDFNMDLRKAIIYSEILQKPLSLRY